MKLIHLLLGFLLTGMTVATKKWLTSSDGRKYMIDTEQKFTWFEALHYCTGLNLQLVEIYSEFKNAPFVEALEKEFGDSQSIWLGATDHLNEQKDSNREFYWVATGNKMNFTYWKDGEPTNYAGQEHCVHTYKEAQDFRWNDAPCNTQRGVACEKHHLTQRLESIRNEKRTKVAEILDQPFKNFDQVQKILLEQFGQLAKEGTKMQTDIKTLLEKLRATLDNGVKHELEERQKIMDAAVDKLIKIISDSENNLQQTAKERYDRFVGGFHDVEKEIDDKINEDWEYQARSNADEV